MAPIKNALVFFQAAPVPEHEDIPGEMGAWTI